VRQSDTTEQRVWLGPSKYLDSCGDAAAADSNSHAESFTFGDSMRAGNALANADCYSERHTYSDGHAERNSVTDTDGNGHSYNYSISDTYGYTKSDTEASADPASSTDPAVSPLANAFGVRADKSPRANIWRLSRYYRLPTG
jgi:hypothetical protein